MGRSVHAVTPDVTQQITARYNEERREHPTYSHATIKRKLAREFGLSVTTIDRHHQGVAQAQANLEKVKPSKYRKATTGQRKTRPHLADGEPVEIRVQRRLLKVASDSTLPPDEVQVFVELAHLLATDKKVKR